MENWSFLVRLLFISHPLMTPLPPAVPGPGARRASRLALSGAFTKPEMKRNIFINKLSKGNAKENLKRSKEERRCRARQPQGEQQERWEALGCFHHSAQASEQHR